MTNHFPRPYEIYRINPDESRELLGTCAYEPDASTIRESFGLGTYEIDIIQGVYCDDKKFYDRVDVRIYPKRVIIQEPVLG